MLCKQVHSEYNEGSRPIIPWIMPVMVSMMVFVADLIDATFVPDEQWDAQEQ